MAKATDSGDSATSRAGIAAADLGIDGLAQSGELRVGGQARYPLLAQDFMQPVGGALGALQLCHRGGDVHLRRAGVGLRAGRQQQALRGAHVAPALRMQLEALAAQAAAGGVLVMDQVAQFQPAVGQAGVQAGAQLAGAVVDDPLLAVAAIMGLAVQAAEHALLRGIEGAAEGWGDLAVV